MYVPAHTTDSTTFPDTTVYKKVDLARIYMIFNTGRARGL